LFDSHIQEPKLTKPKECEVKAHVLLSIIELLREGGREGGREEAKQAGGPFPTLIFVNFRVGRQTCVAEFF
jgi:hypothetical protein